MMGSGTPLWRSASSRLRPSRILAMSSSGDEAPETAAPVHKVLNNNVVVMIDENGNERVLMGRGIGFQLKPSDTIDPRRVEKTFILDSGESAARELRLLTEVPDPVIEAVSRAVDAAERSLGRARCAHWAPTSRS